MTTDQTSPFGPPGFGERLPDGTDERHPGPSFVPIDQDPAGPEATPPAGHRTKRSWWRRSWVIALVALLLGYGVGQAGSSSADTRAKTAESRASAAQDSLKTAQSQAAAAQAQAKQAQDKATVDVNNAKEEAAKAIQPRVDEITKKEGELATRDAELTRREQAVSGAEVAKAEQAAKNTISGDGTFLVGSDIAPGTYKSKGGTLCYWARLAKSGDIIDNDLSNGPAVINVKSSDYSVKFSSCEDFVKQ